MTDPRHLKTARALARRRAKALGPHAKVGVERYGPGSIGLVHRWGASRAVAFAEGPADDTGELRITVLFGPGPTHAELVDALGKAGLSNARPAETKSCAPE